MSVDALRNYYVRDGTVEALLIARRDLTDLIKAMEDEGLDLPPWMTDKLAEMKREIGYRKEDRISKRIKEIKEKLDELKDASERRQELEESLAKLEVALADNG